MHGTDAHAGRDSVVFRVNTLPVSRHAAEEKASSVRSIGYVAAVASFV